ncbi:hypothetical protein GUJ93_ZPchr0071g29180 [Zizania palustris]|uniref:Uncharacterized protein n=1 Tax=Zizania palustris TaxID=103762 RepID=A0A8J5R8X5_ZIZPA|nr:hypothetical protein GUJ93_ZPchr0071g29180 [Zizania palustris]
MIQLAMSSNSANDLSVHQKNSAIAGAIAGAAVALTGDTDTRHADHIVHFAITGAALSSAASLLSGII